MSISEILFPNVIKNIQNRYNLLIKIMKQDNKKN